MREAILAANSDTRVDGCPAGSGVDTILIPAVNYVFSLAGAGEDAGLTGDFDITASVVIEGAGPTATLINANRLDRVFEVFAPAVVKISGLEMGAADVRTANGGGLYVHAGAQAILDSVEFDANEALNGGGLYNSGITTIINSAFVGNVSYVNGGGIGNEGSISMAGSTVSEGASGVSGAGIANTGEMSVSNSTLYDNWAYLNGGGLYADAGQGGVLSHTYFSNVTISGNYEDGNRDGAGQGGGINVQAPAFVQLRNSILAGNVGLYGRAECVGNIVSAGYNLVGQVGVCSLSGVSVGNLVNVNPGLGPFQNNGGLTNTLALLPSSPAIDAGDPSGCIDQAGQLLMTDQRGVPRPQGLACDMGAVEIGLLAAPTVTSTITRTPTYSPTPTSTPTPTFTPTPALFNAYVTYNLANRASEVAIGDFNNDGLNDVAAVAYELLYIVPQTAGHGLGQPVSYRSGGGIGHITTGDFNHDQLTDIAVASSDSTLWIYIQQSDHSLASQVYALSEIPTSIARGDFNNDGLDDIALSSWSGISVFPQTPAGTLGPVLQYPGNYTTLELAAGDLNADGKTDLVNRLHLGAPSDANPNFLVYPQTVDGALGAPTPYQFNTRTTESLAVGDVTGDGLTDVIAVTSANQPYGSVTVFTQTPSGSLQVAAVYSAYDLAGRVRIADVNGDGLNDVVVANTLWNRTSVYLQRPDGRLSDYLLFPINSYSDGMDVGDINGDNLPDVVYTNLVSGLTVLYHAPASNLPASTAAPPVPVLFMPVTIDTAVPGPQSVQIDDFNGDGLMDVAATNGSTLYIEQQGVDHRLHLAATTALGIGFGQLIKGDFNHDQQADLVVVSATTQSVSVCLQQAAGGVACQLYSLPQALDSIAVGDINNDGRDDILFNFGGSLQYWPQNAGGTFDGLVQVATAINGSLLLVADFNGDGRSDILVSARLSQAAVQVYYQQSDGSFGSPVQMGLYQNGLGNTFGSGDVTGDGRTDVVMNAFGNAPYGYLAVFTQDAVGGLRLSSYYNGANLQEAVSIADLNGDGLGDVVAGAFDSAQMSVYLQTKGGQLAAYKTYTKTANSSIPVIGDINGDGLPDVVFADWNQGLAISYQAAPQAQTPTATLTAGLTSTPPATLTPTATPSLTVTTTPSVTLSPAATLTLLPTAQPSPTVTTTPSLNPTAPPSPTSTPDLAATSTPRPAPTATRTWIIGLAALSGCDSL